MKTTYIVFSFLPLLFCCCNSKAKTTDMSKTSSIILQDKEQLKISEIEDHKISKCSISKIDIYYIDIAFETAFRVECYDFHNRFKSDKKFCSISDKRTLCQFELILKDFSQDRDPDTRIQLIVNKSNKDVDTICVDEFTLMDHPKLCELLREIKIVDTPPARICNPCL
jgi:hypothetical protein